MEWKGFKETTVNQECHTQQNYPLKVVEKEGPSFQDKNKLRQLMTIKSGFQELLQRREGKKPLHSQD